jgi:F0F1-type ATP synthase membrane subunit b/b'
MKKQEQNELNPVAVAVTGVIVGAGVVVAGAIALNNKKNQQKIEEALTTAKEKVIDIKKQAEETIDDVEKKLRVNNKKIKKSVASTKDKLNHEAKEEVKAEHSK